MKYWNASHGYPFYSFELETEIAEINFNNDTYESGFLYAIKELSGSDLPDWASDKLDVLKTNGRWVREYIDKEEIQKAKKSLEKILLSFSG